MKLSFPLRLLLVIALLVTAAFEQSPNGTVSGLVLDPSGRAIASADIQILNDVTGVRYPGVTNGEGIYAITDLPPGPYRVQVSKPGFKTLIKPDIVLSVQGALAINFTLPVGALSETVTVEGGASLVNTESAAVSTVVDRQFAENLPMNGRSFQTLIQLTPGVVPTTSTASDAGQFSVNGQRAVSNYWTVDGVSANIGISTGNFAGNGLAGGLPSFSVQGGTNSLVSVDALQEFRIQTSTYAPEFGRTPGGQVSIVTRSGANQFHGTVFDYFRNDVLDANDWFANFAGLKKPQERQNDFGGTLGGPILKNRTFFFFSYEGLRLRLPRTALTTVPDIPARQNTPTALQPFVNAFPLPNGPELGNGIAQFNASFSNTSDLDAYSLRIDHTLNGKLRLFGRYNYSPSDLVQRGVFGDALSTVFPARMAVETATVAGTWTVSSGLVNDARLNYSRTDGSGHFILDDFGGAVPLVSDPFPPSFNRSNSAFLLQILSLVQPTLSTGKLQRNLQRQVNLVDSLALQKGSHTMKFGGDYRRLSPRFDPIQYSQQATFADVPSFEGEQLGFSAIRSGLGGTLFFHNLGVYAQDTWHLLPRLTLTYGLRWEVDFAPSSSATLVAVTGFNTSDLSHLALAPAGTPPFNTTYQNVAPRLGIAYQMHQRQAVLTVLRGGFGVFYDLATSEFANTIGAGSYPFGGFRRQSGGTFPLSSVDAAPPANTFSNRLSGFDPHLRLPYTLQWNVALEQSLGRQQSLSASYIGSLGRRLLQSSFLFAPSPNLNSATIVANTATSDYNALQVQFQRRLSRGFQTLASYSWQHSIDSASAGSLGSVANAFVPGTGNVNRGPSDFDVRHAFSAGMTYELSTLKRNLLAKVMLSGWALQSVVQIRSATPVDVSDASFFELNNSFADVRPDVISRQSLYLYGPQYPGNKAFNPSAFTSPPTDVTGNPLRQGTLGRNALRGFGVTQWDFAVHRDFPIVESLKLQFRGEIFNLLNHPNFGGPSGLFGIGGFGLSTQTLAQSLSGGNVGSGAFSPLYQVGGPRSIQFALKLLF